MFKYLIFTLSAAVTVDTTRELNALQLEVVILSAILAIFALIVSYFVAEAIPYDGNTIPKDPKRRRRWFWAGIIFTIIVYLLYSLFLLKQIVKPNLHGHFITIVLIGAVILFGMYVSLGFLFSRLIPKSKYGTIFPRKNK